MTNHFLTWSDAMTVGVRIASLRKQNGLSQQALADATGIHVTQIKRYEGGNALPSFDALKKLSQVLRVTTDYLVFEGDELKPDADLALQFQAISHMEPEQQKVIKQLLEGMIIKYEAERWSSKLK
ncbi:helix-turn-helix transcriptional regulator [Pectobacterium parmentieri]|nr:helix-turn-helix transcriptional regulator [Pectobacterium parmentieri]